MLNAQRFKVCEAHKDSGKLFIEKTLKMSENGMKFTQFLVVSSSYKLDKYCKFSVLQEGTFQLSPILPIN